MGLIKEPKEVDFSTKSEPWTEEELIDFRKLMSEIKLKNAIRRKVNRLEVVTRKQEMRN
jgi:hypothetical protein